MPSENVINGHSFEAGGFSHHRASRKTSAGTMEDCDVACKVCFRAYVCNEKTKNKYLVNSNLMK